MTKLSVNVNKIATLRNSRGKNIPNVVNVARDVLAYGAHGITIHPRPDGRHIKTRDIYELAKLISDCRNQGAKYQNIEFNIEGYPSDDFLKMIAEVRPDQCTLVPDPPHVLTSNAGWEVRNQEDLLGSSINALKDLNVRSSIFIDPKGFNETSIEALLSVKPDRVELYTEAYADSFGSKDQESVIDIYKSVAIELYDHGVGVNAGHDLSLSNLQYLIENIPVIDEVSIGHALICESLYLGLETTVGEYLKILKPKN